MNPYTIFITIVVIMVVLYNINKIKVICIKPLLLPITSTAFVLLLVLFSETAVKSASNGLNLWFNVVFPSLFPFFVASEILNKTGFIKSIGILLEPIMRPVFNVPGCGSFAFAMGITSGYPVGAKLTASMRKEKLLSKTEAERLLSFTNNSGPLFVVGAVAVGMFKMPGLGLFLLTCHILASITVGVIFRFYKAKKTVTKVMHNEKLIKRFKKELSRNIKSQKLNPGEVLGDAVKNSVNVLLAVGGFIVLFSVIINILIEIGFISFISGVIAAIATPLGINKEIVTSLISGFFEMTTGTSMASKVQNISFVQQLAATSMILGWAGLSVHSQVYSIVCKSDISIKPYLAGKFLQGLFAAFYTYTALKVSGLVSLKAQSVFKLIDSVTRFKWHDYFLYSCYNVLLSLIIILSFSILTLLCINIKRHD
jgi:sporulation integral membrane protein YlbJ